MVDFNIVTASIISGLIVALVSGIIMALLKRHWDKTDKKAQEIEELKSQISVIRKCIWRLNKTVLIMAKILDNQTDKVHGELASNLEDIASELLDSPTSDSDESDKG